MIKYIPRPIPITTEEEETLKRLAHESYEKQKKNPSEVYWWLRGCDEVVTRLCDQNTTIEHGKNAQDICVY